MDGLLALLLVAGVLVTCAFGGKTSSSVHSSESHQKSTDTESSANDEEKWEIVEPHELDPSIVGVPIEQSAVIAPKSRMTSVRIGQMVRLVKLNDYRCDSVSSARAEVFSSDLTLGCNGFRYKYELADIGGKWQVTVK